MLRRVWRPLPPSRVPLVLLVLLVLLDLRALRGVMALLARMVPMAQRGPLVLLGRSVLVVPMALVALLDPQGPLPLLPLLLLLLTSNNRGPNRPEPLGSYPDSMSFLQIKDHPRGRQRGICL